MLIVKIGGAKGVSLDYVLEDFAKFECPKILLHGASDFRNQLAAELGCPVEVLVSESGVEFVKSDEQALDIFLMAYAGYMNGRIVERLQRLGCNAVGLSGLDGQLFRAKRKTAIKVKEGSRIRIERDQLSGKVYEVNRHLLDTLLQAGYVPVLSLPAYSDDGMAINSDNDPLAALLAEVYGAEDLVYLSDVKGLYKAFPDESTLIREVLLSEIDEVMLYAQGRMKRKVMGAKEALEKGVKRVIFGDARVESPIRSALKGMGTVFSR